MVLVVVLSRIGLLVLLVLAEAAVEEEVPQSPLWPLKAEMARCTFASIILTR